MPMRPTREPTAGATPWPPRTAAASTAATVSRAVAPRRLTINLTPVVRALRDTLPMPIVPGRDHPSSLQRLRSAPSVTSGRALLLAMLGLLVCDVMGGFVALASGANSFNEAWGFDTQNTVPLPIGAAQLLFAWLAARNTRPPIGLIAAVLLSVFCLISLMAGLFDGDLIQNVASDGVLSLGVAWAVVLLAFTAVVGLLAAIRAKQLRQRH